MLYLRASCSHFYNLSNVYFINMMWLLAQKKCMSSATVQTKRCQMKCFCSVTVWSRRHHNRGFQEQTNKYLLLRKDSWVSKCYYMCKEYIYIYINNMEPKKTYCGIMDNLQIWKNIIIIVLTITIGLICLISKRKVSNLFNLTRQMEKFINLHRTQLQSYLFIYFIFNLNHTTCFGPSSGHPQVWFLQAQYTEKITHIRDNNHRDNKLKTV
jgi:hypothetical protein